MNQRLSETQQKTMYDVVTLCVKNPDAAIDTLVKLISAFPVESYEALYGEDPALVTEIERLLDIGKPIDAIKLVRSTKGLGLKESKHFVNQYRRDT